VATLGIVVLATAVVLLAPVVMVQGPLGEVMEVPDKTEAAPVVEVAAVRM